MNQNALNIACITSPALIRWLHRLDDMCNTSLDCSKFGEHILVGTGMDQLVVFNGSLDEFSQMNKLSREGNCNSKGRKYLCRKIWPLWSLTRWAKESVICGWQGCSNGQVLKTSVSSQKWSISMMNPGNVHQMPFFSLALTQLRWRRTYYIFSH